MKILQKLEIGFGLATLVSTAIIFCLLASLYIGRKTDDPWGSIYVPVILDFLFYVFPACSVGFGSVFHSARQSRVGFLAILIGGLVLIVIFSISFLGFAVFTGLVRGLLLTTPGFLAAITIFLAFLLRASNQPLK